MRVVRCPPCPAAASARSHTVAAPRATQAADRHRDELGVGAGPALDEAEHPVPHVVGRHALARRRHDAGVLGAQDVDARPSATRTRAG